MPCDIVDGTKLAELFEEDLEEFECEFSLFVPPMPEKHSNPNHLKKKTVANAFGLVENKNVGMPSIVPVTAGKVGPKYALGL